MSESTLFCYVHPKIVPLNKASIPITDLALQRGYGLFDFLRVLEGVPLFLDKHLDRFFYSANELHMTPVESREEIRALIYELIKRNQASAAGIRLFLTGGDSPNGYLLGVPRLIILQQPLPELPKELITPGWTLVTYSYQRQLSHVKSIDYLMAVWLQPWLKEQGANEILYVDNGFIRENPRSNFFIVSADGKIVTPKDGVLHGVTRSNVLTIADRLGIEVEERDISLDELEFVSEAFISSSTKRVIPVRQIDSIQIGNGDPDYSVSRSIFEEFAVLEQEYIKSHQ